MEAFANAAQFFRQQDLDGFVLKKAIDVASGGDRVARTHGERFFQTGDNPVIAGLAFA